MKLTIVFKYEQQEQNYLNFCKDQIAKGNRNPEYKFLTTRQPRNTNP